MSPKAENQGGLSVSAALCVDREAFDRFGGVLRRLLVGLVDQAVHLRLLSSDPRVETLTLGPIQTLVHQRIGWPIASRRIEQLLGALSHQPPTVVHAMSQASYRVAGAVAEAFDADLILQVTSLADCDAIAGLASRMWDRLSSRSNDRLESPSHIRFLVFTQPLLTVLEEQLKIPPGRIDLVRPGVLASQGVACFADPQRTPSILCLSALERGSGVGSLIDAVDILRKRDHRVLLFLLGQGRQEPALRSMVRDRGLSSYVTLAHPAGDLTRAMHGADIFVRPSADTYLCDDGLQAMGAGMVVVTLQSSVCDHYHSNETAVVCDKPTAESLAGAIEGLLNDRANARRIATAGMEYVRSSHAVSSMAQRTADAYRKLAVARATFSIRE